MGLACNNIRLLTLTQRKADVVYNISIDSMEKMALTREQTQLTAEYRAKLQGKSIAYYANGKYNNISYQYIMGYGQNYAAILSGNKPLKGENSMILCDYKGQVVLNDTYANALTAVLGSSAMDNYGRGGTFSKDQIPAILGQLIPGISEDEFRTVINNSGTVSSSYDTNGVNQLTEENTGNNGVHDSSQVTTEKIQQIVDFYYPIFSAAAANGWTTEYNKEMELNDNYVSDAIVSGTFQLESVNEEGNYDVDTSLTYFITAGLVEERTDSSVREEITAWYEEEKAKIAEKEDWLDIDIDNLSTELEAINTEIQSVKSLLEDSMDPFDWGNA